MSTVIVRVYEKKTREKRDAYENPGECMHQGILKIDF